MWRKLKSNLLLRRFLTVLSLDVLVKASAFILLPLYLRLMTQPEYGSFNYVMSVVYSFSTILNLGLYVPQSKIYHDHLDARAKGRLLFNINLLIGSALLIFVVPVYVTGWDHTAAKMLFTDSLDYSRYRSLILLMTMTALFAYMLTNFFYTAERIDLIKRFNLLRVIGINLISLLALYLIKRRDSQEVRFAAIGFVELGLILCFYGAYLKAMVPRIDSGLIRRSLKMGIPMMLSTVFSIVINYGDKFFLEKYAGYTQLSVYYLAFSFSSIISLISLSLQNVWLPLFFKEKDLKKNVAKTTKMISRLALGLIALSILILVSVIVMLRIRVIPASYHEVIYILPLLLTSQILVCLAILYANYLFYFEKTAIVLISGLVVSLISTGLNMILVRRYAGYGAGITILVANALYLLIYYSFFRFYRKKHLLFPEQIPGTPGNF